MRVSGRPESKSLTRRGAPRAYRAASERRSIHP